MNLPPTSAPAVHRLLSVQLGAWPEHEKFLNKRFANTDLGAAERVADLILRLVDDPAAVAQDYRWMCDHLYQEELHFRRNGSYRLSRFEDAVREVYSDEEFMRRYMNGLLISQLWWENHTRVIDCYCRQFLPGNRSGYNHLEIGPGHGLLLYFAGLDPRAASISAWDLSDASLDATRSALSRLAVPRPVSLEKRNLFDAPSGERRFDSIVLSEVCEHLENPTDALAQVRAHLAPGGRLFVNVPVNSPAPDHIYLLKTPEEAVAMVQAGGYTVQEQHFFPMTGYNEQQARRMTVTISCVIVATAAAG